MNAREAFNKLGFEFYGTNGRIMYNKKTAHTEKTIAQQKIVFNFESKSFESFEQILAKGGGCVEKKGLNINKEIFKAVALQLKELRWYQDENISF